MARNPGLNMAYTDGVQRELHALGRTTGSVFYVDSGAANASDNNAGTSKFKPMATLNAVLALCTANNGDQIHVMAGHAETYTAAGDLTLDVAGVEIIGYGIGTTRPTFTLGTAATCDVNVDAANVTIRNLRFVSAINDLAVMLDVNQGDFSCYDCDFVTSSTEECFCFVDIATTKDNFVFKGCRFFQPTDPEGTDGNASTGCFYFVDSENILIQDCQFLGNFETSIFHNKTTAAKQLWIIDCHGTQLNAGVAVVADILAATTGGMVRCSWMVPAAADVTEAALLTIAASCTFGLHQTTFMNDGAGGNAAVEVAVAT